MLYCPPTIQMRPTADLKIRWSVHNVMQCQRDVVFCVTSERNLSSYREKITSRNMESHTEICAADSTSVLPGWWMRERVCLLSLSLRSFFMPGKLFKLCKHSCNHHLDFKLCNLPNICGSSGTVILKFKYQAPWCCTGLHKGVFLWLLSVFNLQGK